MAILTIVIICVIGYTVIGGIWFWVCDTYTNIDTDDCRIYGLIWPLSVPITGMAIAFEKIADLLDTLFSKGA